MHSGTSLPLADIGNLLEGLLPIIVAVLYGIAHLVGALQQEKRKAAAKPRPAPPQEFGLPAKPNVPAAAKPAAAGGNQPSLEETLRREVEEFLRRAQGQQPQQVRNQQRPQQRAGEQQPSRQQRSGQPPRTIRQADQRGTGPEPPRRLVDTPRPEAAKSLSEPVRSIVATTPLGAGVTQYVAEQLRGTQQIAKHAQQLGSDVAQADERLQEHLRQRFVHPVGSLTPSVSATADQRAAALSSAQELRSMLTRPGAARQLIIASEILRRPEERWER
jgi:hypothetical protein